MKKLLSIICTLAIVLGVVLVPGMFSASAAGAVTVVKTAGSVTETDGVYTIASNYKDGYFYTDFKMEAGKTYNLSMNCDVSSWGNNGGVRIFATTLSDGETNPTAASKIKALAFSKQPGTRYLRAWNFTADELLEDGFEYLAIKVNTMDAGTDYTLSGIRVVEVNNGDYLDIVGLEEQAYIYADDEGYENTLNLPWYARHYFTYDYEIDPNKDYLIQYEYKGKNGTDGGVTWRWQASSDKDPSDATVPDKAVGVAHPEGNVWVNEYKSYAIAFKGSQLGADETHKYLTLRGNTIVSAPCYFRKVTITELPSGYIYEIYKGNDVKTGIEDGVPYWTNGGYTGNSTYALNYKLEAGKYYAITADFKGTNKKDNGFRWAAGAVKDPKSNAVTRPTTRTYLTDIPYQNDMPWLTTTSVIAADDIIDTANGLEYLALYNDTHTNTYIRNIKVQEVSFADGYIYPVRTGSETSISYDDAMSWASSQAYGGISLVFDYTIEADKFYTLSYEYHGHNWTSNGADVLRLGLVDLNEVPADRAFPHVKSYWNDAKIVKMSIPSNKTGFTAASTTFKGSDLIDADKAGRVKLALCGQGYPADGWSNAQNLPTFRNFKIEALDPADYTAVDKAIEDANALNKDSYKDFSGVDAAIAAVVRDKLATEQDAVDAMAKAINDAIAALELKGADYSAVDAAIAAAEALDPSDYPNFFKVTQAIVKVDRNKTVADQATIDGYAKAINDAVAALIEDPAAEGEYYPINAGNDVKYTAAAGEEDGYFHNGGYTGNSTYAFNIKLEANKYYLITADIAGTNKIDNGFRWRAAAVTDPTKATIVRPATTSAADLTDIPYQNNMAWRTSKSVIAANDIIDVASGKVYLALVNNTHTTTQIKNIKVQEVSFADGYNYPVRVGSETAKSYDDAMSWATANSYGGMSLVFDFTIEAGKSYEFTYEFHGHNWTGNAADNFRFGLVDLAEVPADRGFPHVKSYWNDSKTVKINVPSNKTGWTAGSIIINGDDLIDSAKPNRTKLAICGQGHPSDAFADYDKNLPHFRNIKIVEYVAPTDADYTAVDTAIAAANALTKANYVDFSAVDAAIAAVVRGKTVEEQAAVDAMAKAITDAIDALVMKGADYAAVNAAKDAAEALDEDLYKDFSAVDAAIAAIVTGKTIDQQADVDAMAKAINDAVAALEFKDADYSVIDELIETIDELDGDLYKNFEDVEDAVAAVVRGKNITEQGDVDAMAQAIALAYAALEFKDADYSELDALVDEAEALDAEDYTNYDAVQEILDEITDDKNITEQDEVDAWAEALEAAIDALIERADYSAFLEIVEKYEDEIGEEEEYTEESVAALKAVMDKIAANANLPADKQADVDALAEEFEAAIKALVKKPVADNNDSKVEDKEDEKVEDNKTDKTPDKTGDSSNIVVAIAALAASVIGLAVLVIGKKRRA